MKLVCCCWSTAHSSLHYQVAFSNVHLTFSTINLLYRRNIEHNNIIKLLAYIESDDVIRPRLLIFEQLCGSSLARTIYDEKQQFGIHEIFNILHDVILALEYLHNQFIVHNYINAQSIYSLETKAVIGDFQYAQDTRMEQFPITSIVSQLPWMAPAQAEGALPDVASDIYRYD